MILSDRSILEAVKDGRIIIEPFDPDCLQPSSVDLHLDYRFLVFKNHTLGHIDVREDLSPKMETQDLRCTNHGGDSRGRIRRDHGDMPTIVVRGR